MRTIPGMVVMCPADDVEARAAVRAALEHEGPVYLRFGRSAEGISAEVLSICTIKPLDEELVLASAGKTGRVVTVEEHSVIGGLGSAVCDCLSEKLPTRVKRLGMQDVFGESGPAAELVAKYGLDAEGVFKSVKAFVKG